MINRDPFTVARFLSMVRDHSDSECCWEWAGHLNSNGYGRFPTDNTVRLAHRVAFEMFFAPIPEGKNVCHKCDNRKCVNPAHLWLGTQSDNLKDAAAKGRMFRPDTTGERNGNRKLCWSDVRNIRRLFRNGMIRKHIAQIYGVAPSTVGEIVSNKIWKEAA